MASFAAHMRELIEEILAAEEQGSRQAAAAKARALEIKGEAKKKAAALLAAGREEARAAADRAAAEAGAAALREKAALLEAASVEIQNKVRLDDGAKSSAAAEVVRKVLGL